MSYPEGHQPITTTEDGPVVGCTCGTTTPTGREEFDTHTRLVRRDGGEEVPSETDPLPALMRQAADTLVAATRRYHPDRKFMRGHPDMDPELVDWRPANLRYVADQFEAESAVQKLARELRDSSHMAPVRRTEEYEDLARHLVTEKGWRKGGSDMSRSDELKQLIHDMRVCADDVLPRAWEELFRRWGRNDGPYLTWRSLAGDLRQYADEWEAEDNTREDLVRELVDQLSRVQHSTVGSDEPNHSAEFTEAVARYLIEEEGWHK